ncbi:MAG: aminoacyl-tRNA hydrolase [Alphaproteobacteria bacterium]|nr:aminoacyl-tRNA hydrolase [Alphaproteobacteria bacterium]
MILLVGLGNPGSEYALTRHNVGFMAVDEIVRRYSFDGWTKKFKGEVCAGTIDGQKVLVLKPHTYMNLSGESVLAISSFYKISLDKIYVFHDDMDLPLGRLKVKQGGGSGGHNGLKSIDAHLGQNYHRIRIGVDKPAMREQVVSWVLSKFASNDKQTLDDLIIKITDNISTLLTKDGNSFMNKVK